MTYLGHIFPRLPTPFAYSDGVAIRTNSYGSFVKVNAANDEVTHYGKAKEIDIVRVKKGTYTEHGGVLGNINLAQGKVSIASNGSVSNVVVKTIDDVVPSASNVEVNVDNGAEVNAVIADSTASSINISSISHGEVTTISYNANSLAFKKDGTQLTTVEDVATALESNQKITLLKDADFTPLKRAIRNPIMVSTDFDLNGYKAYVLHFGLVANKDNITISNGTVSTAKTNYVNTKLYEVSSSNKDEIDRYGMVVQADNVKLAGLKVLGGVSLGGDATSYDPSYEHCTPVNSKGNNAGNNTKVIGCTLVALSASNRYSIFAQSGSCGAGLEDTILEGTGVNTKLINIASSIGDFGALGDKNEIVFKNVQCTANPFTVTTISVSGVVQFEVQGDVDGTRKIIGKTGYASSDVVIERKNNVWVVNGTLGYTVH